MARAKATYDLVAQDKSKGAFASIKKSLGGLKGAIGGLGLAFGAAGFARFVKGALDAGDEVQKLAIQTGASTEFLSEMRGVLELSGVSYSSFTKGLQKGNLAVAQAQQGSSTMITAFRALGLEVSALSQLSPEEQFFAIGEALNQVQSPVERNALSMQLLGGRLTELNRLFELGPDKIAEMRAEQVSFGNSLSRDMVDKMAEANDAMSRLGQQMSGLGSRLAAEFAGPIADGAAALGDVLIPVLKFAGGVFGTLGDIIGAVGATLVAFFSGNFSEAASIASLAVTDLTDRLNQMFEASEQGDLSHIGTSPAVVAGPQTSLGAAFEAIKDEKKAAAEERKRLKAEQRALEKANKDPQLQTTNATLKSIDKRLETRTYAIAG